MIRQLSILFFLAVQVVAQTPSLDRAALFYKHGLADDAKRDVIVLLTSPALKSDHDAARMMLAQLAVDDGRVKDAVDLWKDVAASKTHPEHAKSAKLLLEQFADVLITKSEGRLSNLVAERYLKNAAFWLRETAGTLAIDTSWLNDVAAGTFWLEKTIKQFPRSRAAELSYVRLIRAQIGVKGTGRYNSGASGALGAEADSKRAAYMQKAESALRKMETELPGSPQLQRLRFMIVYAYWLMDDRKSAQPWLDAIIKASGDGMSFWRQMAELRSKTWRG